MNSAVKNAVAVAGLAFAANATAEVIFFEREGFGGRSFSTAKQVRNFERFGFNDRASSVVVKRERWEVCEDARFEGRCVVLRPGRYASLAAMGLNDRVSSVRIVSRQVRVEDNRYAPPPVPFYDASRRKNEQLFQADVTSVRAVVGQPEQRCWVEREQVSQDRGNANVPGAIVGAIIGGVLGHQVGSGRGNTAATVVGAGAGAYAGHQIEKNQKTSTKYQVVVKMNESGDTRTFTYNNPTSYRVGDKIRIIDKKLVRQK